jgi:hypothetical protein
VCGGSAQVDTVKAIISALIKQVTVQTNSLPSNPLNFAIQSTSSSDVNPLAPEFSFKF